jgi:hypothetical protein
MAARLQLPKTLELHKHCTTALLLAAVFKSCKTCVLHRLLAARWATYQTKKVNICAMRLRLLAAHKTPLI